MCGVEATKFAVDFQNTITVELDPRIFPSFSMVLDRIISVLRATATMATSAAMATAMSAFLLTGKHPGEKTLGGEGD